MRRFGVRRSGHGDHGDHGEHASDGPQSGPTTKWRNRKHASPVPSKHAQSIIGKRNFRCIWTRLPPYSCLDHKLWVGPGRDSRTRSASLTRRANSPKERVQIIPRSGDHVCRNGALPSVSACRCKSDSIGLVDTPKCGTWWMQRNATLWSAKERSGRPPDGSDGPQSGPTTKWRNRKHASPVPSKVLLAKETFAAFGHDYRPIPV